MTIVATRTRPQVFLSFALADRKLAEEVATKLDRSGLSVVRMDERSSEREYDDTVRTALRQSAAVVAVLSGASRRHDMPANVLFEIGAAIGARKPIYVVVDDASAKLPFGAPDLRVLPLNRLDEVARELAPLEN